jgi:hypothetical protein
LRCARHVMAGSSINTDAPRGELKLGGERRVFSSHTLLNVLGSLDRVRARGKTDTRQCQSLTRAWIWEFKRLFFSLLRGPFWVSAFEASIP